jgi:hypothetical protein
LARLSLAPPRSLTLCDLPDKQATLEHLAREARESGFTGPIDILTATDGRVPDALYRSRTIIGATNEPSVMDVRKVLPGTIIVDDSGPHCFDAAVAIERLESDGDILFTRAGQLTTPEPINRIQYLPERWKPLFGPGTDMGGADRFIEGCVLSALLAATQTNTAATVGETSAEECLRQLRLLEELGYEAGPLECVGYRISADQVSRFLRHGSRESSDGTAR